MVIDGERNQVVWQSALDFANNTQPRWMISFLLVPAVMWLILVMAGSFEASILRQSSLVLGLLTVLSLGSFSSYRALKSKPRTNIAHRRSAFLLILYSTVMFLSLSAMTLRISYEISQDLQSASWLQGIYIFLYFIVAIGSLMLAPYTISTPEQAKQQNMRVAPWLPLIAKIQSIALGTGIVLGTWSMHTNDPWTTVLILALSLILAYMLGALGMVGLHRSWTLARTIHDD